MAQRVLNQCGDFPSLVAVDGGLWSLDVHRSSRLSFYKTRNILLPGDEINLSGAARRAEIAAEHDVSLLSEVKGLLFFAGLSDVLMRGAAGQAARFFPQASPDRGCGSEDAGRELERLFVCFSASVRSEDVTRPTQSGIPADRLPESVHATTVTLGRATSFLRINHFGAFGTALVDSDSGGE